MCAVDGAATKLRRSEVVLVQYIFFRKCRTHSFVFHIVLPIFVILVDVVLKLLSEVSTTLLCCEQLQLITM